MSIQSDPTAHNSGVPLPPLAAPVPPLETGDCLSRAEFERRYEAMPQVKKAELVEGVAYVSSPVGRPHGVAHARLMTWLGVYAVHTPVVEHADNMTVRFDLKNEVQPDALLRLVASAQSRIGPDDFIEGAPEFVAEVASTSVSRDLHAKLDVYLRHGVREYLVWRVLDGEIDWFRLHEGEFQRLNADAAGVFRSLAFPGLWLDRAALLRGDMATVLSVLNQGLASAEHAAFVAPR